MAKSTAATTSQAIDRVREYMQRHGLSRYKMAILAGVNYSSIYHINEPDFSTRTATLEKLEAAIRENPKPKIGVYGVPGRRRRARQSIAAEG